MLLQLLVPAFADLFDEQIPDHIHLHLIVCDLESDGSVRFIQPAVHDGTERVRIVHPALGESEEQILQSFEQTHGRPPLS